MSLDNCIFYIASTPFFQSKNWYKLGITHNLNERLSTYRTGCPPVPEYESEYTNFKELAPCSESTEKNILDKKFKEYFSSLCRARDSGSSTEWHNAEYHILIDMFVRFFEQDDMKQYLQQHIIEPLDPLTSKRNQDLDMIQDPIIESIVRFYSGPDEGAIITAPCGSGKTRMCVKSLKKFEQFRKIIVVVPSILLQSQWKKEMLSIFSDEEITINYPSKRKEYCILITNKSSHLLISHIEHNVPDVVIYDECHHMEGFVGEDGEGETRKFLLKVVENKIKRLFLTATPRYLNDTQAISMYDKRIFGEIIASISYKELVDKEILPRPSLSIFGGEDTIQAKCQTTIDIWTKHFREQINHLIIFTQWHRDAIEVDSYIRNYIKDGTKILYLDGSTDSSIKIKEFQQAARAIIINVNILSEGADIPCADSVIFMTNIKSHERIIQGIMRPGRYFARKSIFHIILVHIQHDSVNIFKQSLERLLERSLITGPNLLSTMELPRTNEVKLESQLTAEEKISRDTAQTEEDFLALIKTGIYMKMHNLTTCVLRGYANVIMELINKGLNISPCKVSDPSITVFTAEHAKMLIVHGHMKIIGIIVMEFFPDQIDEYRRHSGSGKIDIDDLGCCNIITLIDYFNIKFTNKDLDSAIINRSVEGVFCMVGWECIPSPKVVNDLFESLTMDRDDVSTSKLGVINWFYGIDKKFGIDNIIVTKLFIKIGKCLRDNGMKNITKEHIDLLKVIIMDKTEAFNYRNNQIDKTKLSTYSTLQLKTLLSKYGSNISGNDTQLRAEIINCMDIMAHVKLICEST